MIVGTMQLISASDKETTTFGKHFASELRGGDVVCLSGELGAGKTTLVKGVAEGLGITNTITSPTFTLMNVYTDLHPTPYKLKTLVHIDTYRLKDEKELIEIGVEDYLGMPGVITIIEWPEKIDSLLKNKKLIKISLEHGPNNTRTIKVV